MQTLADGSAESIAQTASQSQSAVVVNLISPNQFLKISETRYLEISSARRLLDEANLFEEKFWMVCESFRELEESYFTVLQSYSFYSGFDSATFLSYRSLINLRLMSFLSCARLYLDTFDSIVEKISGGTATMAEAQKIRNSHHQNCFEYRLLELLRNYAQHYSLPVHSIQLGGTWTEDRETLEYRVNFAAIIERLLQYNDWRKVRAELEKTDVSKIDLKKCARIYFSRIGEIHGSAREISMSSVAAADKCLKATISNWQSEFPDSESALLSAYKVDADGKFDQASKLNLVIPDDELREAMQKRLGAMSNMHRRKIAI